jgi:LysR family hydrogen peroxide-inducible transcriptional activator
MSIRPTHRQLEYLVAVGETGHFGAAARKCNVSQPTLSTQIQLLEDRLKAKLIERAPGGARPTPLGDIVIGLSRGVLATLDEIQNVTLNASENLGGLIRLGVVPTFGPYFLPHVLPRLHVHYPGLELYIREERPVELQNSILAGTLDCALTPPPDDVERLEYREITTESLRLGIPVDHPLAAETSIRPAMLKGERVLTLGPDHQLNQSVQAFCQSSGAVLSEDYEGTSLDAVRQMVSIGMGLSLFPEFYIASEFPKETGVVLRDVVGWSLTRSIGLVWRKGSVRSVQFAQLCSECEMALTESQRE